MAFDITVTVASGTVDSDLTDFPLYIDLSTLPAEFWDGMATDGAKIRVYESNGTTQLPFDIAYINTTNDTGMLFVKTDLATASDTVIHIKDDGVGTLATDATYGSEAVWSDYEVAIVGNDQKDHTDDTSLSSAGTPTDSGIDGLLFNANGEKVYGTTTTTDNEWTLSSVIKLNNITQRHYLAAYDTNFSTGRHSIYVNLTNNFWEYNNTDGNNSSTIQPVADEWYHVANRQNGTTDRKLYVDGVLGATDTGVTSCWPAAGTKYVVSGGDHATAGEANFYGRYTVLRTGAVAEDWLEAEADNHKTPATFYSATGTFDISVTVASGKVDSDLTDFPLFISLEDLPQAFWGAVSPSGAEIRVYESDGTTQLPFDIAYFDQTTKVGHLYVKTDLATASDTMIHIKGDGTGLLAVTDTYGRNAVWSDYEVVFAGNTSDDRTANATSVTTGTPTESGIDGWLIDTDGEGIYSINNADTDGTWTLSGDVKIAGSSTYPDVFGYNYADTGTNRLVCYYDSVNNRYDFYDGTANGTLVGGSTNIVYEDEWHNIAVRYDGTTDRRLFVDGTQDAIDTTITAAWGSGGSKKIIMGNGQSANNDSDSYNRYLAFRNAVLSTDWIKAEGENHSSPGTFYVVGDTDYEYLIDFSRGGRLSNIADIAHAVGGAHDLTYPTYASYKNGFARILDTDAQELRGSGLKRVDNTTGDYGYGHTGIEYQEAAHPTGGTLVWPQGVMIEPASYLRTDKALYLDTATTLYNATLVADEDCGEVEGWLLTADTSDNPHYFSGHTASNSSEVIFTAILKDDGSGTRVMFRGAGNGSDSTEWPRMVIDMGTGDILESDYDLTSPGLFSAGGKRDLGDGWTEYWMQLHRSSAQANYAQVFLAPSDWVLADGAYPDYVGSTSEKVLIASVQTKTHINNAMQLTAPIGDDEAQPVYGGDELTITPNFAPANTEGAILLRLVSYSLKWDNTNPEATATYYAQDVITNGTTTVLSITEDGYLKLEDGTNTVTGTTDIHDGAEHDVVMSWSSGDSTMKIYLDGLEEATGSYDGTFPSLSTIEIGHAGFNGVLSKFGISASKYSVSTTLTTLAATTTLTASLDKTTVFSESLTGTTTLTATLAKMNSLSLTDALTAAASLAKDVNAQLMAATSTLTASFARTFNLSLDAVLNLVAEPNENKFGQLWTPYRSLPVLAHYDHTRTDEMTLNVVSLVEVKDQTPQNLDMDVIPPHTASNITLTGGRFFTTGVVSVLRADILGKLPEGTDGVTLVSITDQLGGSYGAGVVYLGYGDITSAGGFVGIGHSSANDSPRKIGTVIGPAGPGGNVNLETGNSNFIDSGYTWDGDPHIDVATIEDGDQQFFRDGVAGSTGSETMNIDIDTHPYLYMMAGYDDGTSYYDSNMYAYQFMVIGKVLTTDERQRLEAWLINHANEGFTFLDSSNPYSDNLRSFEPITLTDTATLSMTIDKVQFQPQSIFAGLTVTGALSSVLGATQSMLASLNLTATTQAQVLRVMAVSLVATGALYRRLNQSMNAGVTVASDLLAALSKVIFTTVGQSAALSQVRMLMQSMSASLSLTGALTKVSSFVSNLTASVSLTATVDRAFQVIKAAGLTVTATVNRQLTKIVTVTASVAANVALYKTVFQDVLASISITGTLQSLSQSMKTLAASLTLTGSVTTFLSRTMAATVSLAGPLLRRVAKPLTGLVTVLADMNPAQFRVITGTLTVVADLVKALPSTAKTWGKAVVRAAAWGISRIR